MERFSVKDIVLSKQNTAVCRKLILIVEVDTLGQLGCRFRDSQRQFVV